MDIVQQLDDHVTQMLVKAWGGRLPTWDEFKQAKKAGRVRTNAGVANKTIHNGAVPKAQRLMFGIITPWGMFLAPIVAIGAALMGYIGWWGVAGGLFLGWYLYKVTLAGACDAVSDGAEQNEGFYTVLLMHGAFFFEPSK